MEEKKKQGGKRRGAGRKPVMSKKKQISLYVEGAKILKFGNEEKLKAHLYGVIESFDDEIDLATVIKFAPATKGSFDGKNNSHVIQGEHSVWQEVKSTTTGLPPKLSPFSDLMAELDKCETYGAVENVMKKAKGEAFIMRDKMALESKAKQIISEKGLYND